MNDQPQDVEMDKAGHDSDTSGSVRAQPDFAGSLTIDETYAVLIENNLRRNPRSIRRYCKSGALECHQRDTQNGWEYVISRTSLDNYISHQKEILLSKSKGTQPDVSGHDQATLKEETRSASNDHGEMVELLKEQLLNAQQQLAEKDRQMAEILERSKETNVLFHKSMDALALPTGQDKAGHSRTANIIKENNREQDSRGEGISHADL